MTDGVARKTRQSASMTGSLPELQPRVVDLSAQDPHPTSSPPTTSAAPATPMDAPARSPSPDEANRPPADPADEQSAASSTEALSKRIKIIHRHWERVCHAVPKCDTCGKKSGQAGILQRCLSCTTQL